MGMVIRVVYNNQGWQALCKTPGKDSSCWRCFQPGLAIRKPEPNDEVCSGDCWERRLRTEYRYGCIPKGRTYGSRAQPGIKVFFVFRQGGGKYTLWGKTSLHSVDSEPVKEGQDYEKGFAFAHFEPFEPLPREKWVPDLTDKELVGAPWRMGLHRFISSEQETKLEPRIESLAYEAPSAPKVSSRAITVSVSPTMYTKLENIASDEGRELDEIVREAVAEWLRDREK